MDGDAVRERRRGALEQPRPGKDASGHRSAPPAAGGSDERVTLPIKTKLPRGNGASHARGRGRSPPRLYPFDALVVPGGTQRIVNWLTL
jgi:hypothetical protein